MTIKLGTFFELEITLKTIFMRLGNRQLWLEKGHSCIN